MTDPTLSDSNLPDTIEVNDLDQFVQHLTAWHSSKIKACEHLLEVPEGSEFEVDGAQLVMSKEVLAGFKLGVELSLMQLKELPFVAELENAAG